MKGSPYNNLRWPEAIWDISGAFVYDREIISFHDFCQTVFQHSPVHYVHGSPLCQWNSGRVNKKFSIETEDLLQAFNEYAAKKIAILYTFSNHLLTEEHINDKVGNVLLQALAKEPLNPTKRNGVIMSSDLLNEHVKANYPTLQRIPSILKITVERGKGKLDVYKQFLEEYDLVMVHPDDVIDFDFLEQLPDKERCILLINEYCVRNCPIRHLHYKDLSSISLNYLGHNDEDFPKLQMNNGCQNIHTLLLDDNKSVLALNTPEIDRLYAMGFRHFKLQGRGIGNSISLLTNLLTLCLGSDAEDENAMATIQQRFWDCILPISS